MKKDKSKNKQDIGETFMTSEQMYNELCVLMSEHDMAYARGDVEEVDRLNEKIADVRKKLALHWGHNEKE